MTTQSDSLDLFVDRLLEEKGLEGLEPDVLAQVRTDLLDRIENRINAAILERMPADQMDAFSRVLDSGDGDKIQAFCAEHIPDMDGMIATELLNFRQTYVGG